jgi:DNA-binding SARP family transcriptional activator
VCGAGHAGNPPSTPSPERYEHDRPNRYRYAVPSRGSARLDIRLMGSPEIRVDGAPLVVDTRKAIAVIALLATDRRPLARDEIAALLWPEADDAAARGALRRTLSTLRTGLGEGLLHIDRARVELDRRHASIDIEVIERAARSDDRRVLDAAASLARGAFMAGFNLRDSPEFDDWRAARATAVERSVVAVFDRLVVAEEKAGDVAAAIEVAERRLDLDPLDERAHVRLMELYASIGDRVAALRQYRACVSVLDRELGVAPLESTTARYETIRDADERVEAAATARGSGPDAEIVTVGAKRPPIPALVGREAAMDALRGAYAAAAHGSGRIVVITGEAGIGKTRLGDVFAGYVRDGGGTVLNARAYQGERGIAYGPIVELLRSALSDRDAVGRLDRATVRTELARLLPAIDPGGGPGPARADGPGAHARLVAAIADGLTSLVAGPVPGCIWIDDLHFADGATLEALDYLARRLAGRSLLVLLAWRPDDLDEATEPVARRLAASPSVAVELARLDREAVAELANQVTTDPIVVDRLFQASEGLPLYVVEALAAGDLALGSMPVGVRAVLRARLGAVGEPAAQVLAAASVIGRSFDFATVRHASGRSEGETVDALDESLRRGLVRESGTGFDFAHGGLRDLVYESTSLTRRRLLHRRIAAALRRDLAGSGREDLARLAQIAAHEREGGRSAEAADAFRLAGARAAAIFANREAIEHDEAALALGHPDITGLHAAIGRLRTRLGDYAGAIGALEAAAAAADDTALPEIERAIAAAHLRRGDLMAAARHLEAAREGSADPAFLARVEVDRSVVLRLGGDHEAALAAARRALDAAVRADDAAAIGAAHRSLGLIALASGDADAARMAARLAVAATDDDPTARIAGLTGLALAEAAAGDVDAGLQHGRAALELCREIGDRHLEGAVENHLADILHAAGRDDDAMDHLRRAVEAFAEIGGDAADPDPGIWMLSAS